MAQAVAAFLLTAFLVAAWGIVSLLFALVGGWAWAVLIFLGLWLIIGAADQ